MRRRLSLQHELEQHQLRLADELKHRIKNTLAVAIAIANQTLRGKALDAERKALTSRLMALSDAQDILTKSNGSVAAIQTVVEGALKPYRSGLRQIHSSGPAFDLGPKQALALSLTINELATNACKYGALSLDTARVDIDWKQTASEDGSDFSTSHGVNPTDPRWSHQPLRALEPA